MSHRPTANSQRAGSGRGLSIGLWLLLLVTGWSSAVQADPLHSPHWDAMVERYLDGGPVIFDERVKVVMPDRAEDALSVPVEARVEGIEEVEEMRLIADLNPLPYILSFKPTRAEPFIAFRFKVEQSTPVRAAARTSDGVWHVGGAWLSAAGGGCTAPSYGTGSGLWRDELNNVSARMWPRGENQSRLKLRIMHPMDTGLAAGIPVFHIETVELLDDQGQAVAEISTYEPVSENPVLSLNVRTASALTIRGRDIQGNLISGQVSP